MPYTKDNNNEIDKKKILICGAFLCAVYPPMHEITSTDPVHNNNLVIIKQDSIYFQVYALKKNKTRPIYLMKYFSSFSIFHTRFIFG